MAQMLELRNGESLAPDTTTVGHLSFNQDPGAVLAHTEVLPAPDNQKENFMLGIKR